MDNAVQFFWFLLATGILFICIEVFLPGGVLGMLGGLALVGAVGMSFAAFQEYGGLVALGIIFLTGAALIVWIRIFPHTPFGKRLILMVPRARRIAAPNPEASLVGKNGVALSNLHPSGIAKIDEKRTDVVTEGQLIAKGESIRVVDVQGMRVVVRKANT